MMEKGRRNQRKIRFVVFSDFSKKILFSTFLLLSHFFLFIFFCVLFVCLIIFEQQQKLKLLIRKKLFYFELGASFIRIATQAPF